MKIQPYGEQINQQNVKYKKKEINGLGDVVAMVAEPIARFSDKHFGTKLAGCGGCAKRRQKLNSAVPFNSNNRPKTS